MTQITQLSRLKVCLQGYNVEALLLVYHVAMVQHSAVLDSWLRRLINPVDVVRMTALEVF